MSYEKEVALLLIPKNKVDRDLLKHSLVRDFGSRGITEGDATETFNLIKSMLQTPALIDIATQLRASRALAAKQVSDFIKRARKVLWY